MSSFTKRILQSCSFFLIQCRKKTHSKAAKNASFPGFYSKVFNVTLSQPCIYIPYPAQQFQGKVGLYVRLPGEPLMLNGSSKPVIGASILFISKVTSLTEVAELFWALICLLHSLPAHSLEIYQCKMFFACTFIFYLIFYTHGWIPREHRICGK